MTMAEERGRSDSVTVAPSSDDNSRRRQAIIVPGAGEGGANRGARDANMMPNGDPPSLVLWGMDERK